MGCCKNNKNDNNVEINRENPEGIEPCCLVQGRRCMCLPYDDRLMITAQILTIVTVFVSWVWWVTFCVSIIGMVMIQILWCCRQNRSMVVVSAAVAVVCTLASIGVGIYILVVWSKETRCYPFHMTAYHYDDDIQDDRYNSWNHEDYCEEAKWATIALVCGVLWSVVSTCIVWFVKSGRHARWEKHYAEANSTTSTAEVELGAVSPDASMAVAEHAVIATISLPETVKADHV